VRTAVTLEQCWHRIPGGTAVATLGQLRGLQAVADEPGAPPPGGLELVGVAARHPATPPPAWAPPIPVRQLPLPRPALYEAWHTVGWPPVQRATGPVDVVHATTLVLPPASAPLAVTVHDLAFLRFPEVLTRRGLRFHRRGLVLLRRRADLVLCPSATTAAEVVGAGFPSERVRVVPWGVDPERAGAAAVDDVRARHGLARPYVLFVGTLEPRKNLAGLIAAFRQVGEGHDLVLVGPSGWGADLAELARGLEGRVRALGFVPEADRRALVAGAVVAAQPSWHEGFGLPVLEAMAQGTPVLTSSGTGTEDVAGGAALLVEPGDAAALAAALEHLLRDEGARARLAADGLARAAQLTWAATGRATLAAYRELA
jgi:glycosyltransferase involved in cell wall biosynthesis